MRRRNRHMRMFAYLSGVAGIAIATYWAATVGAAQSVLDHPPAAPPMLAQVAQAPAPAAQTPVQTEVGAPANVTTTLTDAPATRPVPPTSAANGEVDETALRYFAQQGDTE